MGCGLDAFDGRIQEEKGKRPSDWCSSVNYVLVWAERGPGCAPEPAGAVSHELVVSQHKSTL